MKFEEGHISKLAGCLNRLGYSIPGKISEISGLREFLDDRMSDSIGRIDPTAIAKMPDSDLVCILDRPSSVGIDRKEYDRIKARWRRRCKKWGVTTHPRGVTKDRTQYYFTHRGGRGKKKWRRMKLLEQLESMIKALADEAEAIDSPLVSASSHICVGRSHMARARDIVASLRQLE